MNTIILFGDEELRGKYIAEFIKKHSLPAYSIHFFEGGVKIADIRACIKVFSQKLGKEEKRVAVFNGEITQDAQNAVLKLLEELSENSYIIFSVAQKEELLSTIHSRCLLVPLLSENTVFNNDYVLFVQNYLQKKNLASVFSLSEKLNITTDFQYEEFLLSVRHVLLSSLHENSDHKVIQTLFTLLTKVIDIYPLVTKNNVNKKYALESIFLST